MDKLERGDSVREPTEKQIKYASSISKVLDVPMPESLTRQSLFIFIRDNAPKYKQAWAKWRQKEREDYQRYLRENCSNKGYKYYSDNTYAGAYGSDIVDCYDYGICPWGDS